MQKYTDITIICKDGEIGAHILILSTSLKWFLVNKRRNISHILAIDYTKENMQDILEFLYTGKKHFNISVIPSVQKFLNLYQCSYQIMEDETEDVVSRTIISFHF